MPFASGPRASAGTSLGRAVWAANHAWVHLSKEKRSPRLLCLETYLRGQRSISTKPLPPAGHYRTLQFAKVLGGKAGGALTFSPTVCSLGGAPAQSRLRKSTGKNVGMVANSQYDPRVAVLEERVAALEKRDGL